MTGRRRFTADFKAKVALGALRGDKTIQEIAARHKVHPNQVSTWKRQAMDGLGAVFSNGSDKARMNHDDEVHDLHAKIALCDDDGTTQVHGGFQGQGCAGRATWRQDDPRDCGETQGAPKPGEHVEAPGDGRFGRGVFQWLRQGPDEPR